MGEVRALTEDDEPDGFEPEIDWRTAEGVVYTLRLDFGVAREIKRKFKVDLLAKTFSWADLKMELWPDMALLLIHDHHPDVTVAEMEKILHPRNATLLVRRFQDLFAIFNASDHEELERAWRAISALVELEAAPAEVQTHAQELARWIRERIDGAEGATSPSPEDDEEPTG